MLNETKEWMAAPLVRLQNRMKKRKRFKAWRRLFISFGRYRCSPEAGPEKATGRRGRKHDRSAQHGQAWDAVIQLLEEFAGMMGEDEISLALFQQMLETGTESLHFSLIPPALDQVFVGNMDLSRMYGTSCTFVIGANDGVLPARPDENGVLSDDDREWLKAVGVELSSAGRERRLMSIFSSIWRCRVRLTVFMCHTRLPMRKEKRSCRQSL